MSLNVTDTPPPSELEQGLGRVFGGGDEDSVSLRSLLGAIDAAKTDNRIAGIFLTGSFEPQGYGSGFAALREVREALQSFRDAPAHKPVVAYLVAPSKRDYYLASVASRVYLNPFGEMDFAGFASEPTFYKGALDKYGIGVQVTRVGKYKSFVEPYILQKMSPENREQTTKLLGDLWTEFKAGVEQDRHIPAEQLQAIADQNGIVNAETAKQTGLVNDLAYLPDVLDGLRRQTGDSTDSLTDRHTFKQVDLATYAKQMVGKPLTTETTLANLTDKSARLAVVYAEGDIVDGEGDAAGAIGGDRFARVLRRLRNDPSVKGILLRVNSPGGSGLASEVIQHELELTRAAGKPVVVSMGTVAASGGYYISTAADRVFAEPNTITGSIGVFGILPNIQGIANNNGVTFDSVKTGKLADLFTVSRPKTPEELNVVQALVDQFYSRFKERVATGRKLKVEQVEEIAQGRVWSGEEAIKIGLVDEIGGFDKALAFAKTQAHLPAGAKIVEYPAPRELAETLAELFEGEKRPVASAHLLHIPAHAGPLPDSSPGAGSDLRLRAHHGRGCHNQGQRRQQERGTGDRRFPAPRKSWSARSRHSRLRWRKYGKLAATQGQAVRGHRRRGSQFSQTGEAAAKLKAVLSQEEIKELADGGEVSTEDILAAQMAARAGETGITYVAFHRHAQNQDAGAFRYPS